MQPNDLKTFMESISPDKPYVTCPACGNHMALRDISSYRMALSDNARDELNRAVQAFRNILLLTEAELARINRFGVARPNVPENDYPHQYERKVFAGLQPDGTYANSIAAIAARKLITTLDVFEFKKYFHEIQWKPHSRSAMSKIIGNGVSKAQKIQPANRTEPQSSQSGRAIRADNTSESSSADPAIKVLLNGLEKASITGPLIDLIMDQDRVTDWVRRATDDDGVGLHPNLHEILNEVSPHYAQYLSDILEKVASENEQDQVVLRQQILHSQLILILFLGHASLRAGEKSRGLFGGNDPFELPGTTHVSDHYRLEQLLSSHLVMKYSNLSWNPEVASAVGMISAPDTKNSGSGSVGGANPPPSPNGKDIDKVETVLKGELDKLIQFKCSGPAGSLFNIDASRQGDIQQEESYGRQAFCGWYPKDADTYPVVLLGSPGCGKSTVMLTGLLAFCESVSALGAEVSFDRPEDMEVYNRNSAKYWAGQLPEPTPMGTRQSIHLKVQQTSGESQGSAYFVFTDIPGEMLTACLESKGPSSALLGILAAAEAIVFFFDMTIENSIRLALCNQTEKILPENKTVPLGERENKWLRLVDSMKKVKEDRNEKFVEYSQLSLLNKVIANLKMKHGANNGNVSGTNFICVLPKIDLFADLEEENDSHMFFNDYFEFLVENNLIYHSPYTYGKKYAGFLSAAGIGSKFYQNGNGEYRTQNGVDRALQLIEISNELSIQAQKGLRNIGKAFYHYEPEAYPEAVRLRDMLQSSLMEKLEQNFSDQNIYFLPVCAQGQSDRKKEKRAEENKEKGGKEAKDTSDDGNDSYIRNLGAPPNQKMAEFVFMLPVALSLRARASMRE